MGLNKFTVPSRPGSTTGRLRLPARSVGRLLRRRAPEGAVGASCLPLPRTGPHEETDIGDTTEKKAAGADAAVGGVTGGVWRHGRGCGRRREDWAGWGRGSPLRVQKTAHETRRGAVCGGVLLDSHHLHPRRIEPEPVMARHSTPWGTGQRCSDDRH